MRRRRAGLPTATPKSPRPKPDEPSQSVIYQISRWVSQANSWRLRGIGAQVLKGMTFEPDENGKIHLTDARWEELWRRYKMVTEERRAERKREQLEALEAAKPKPRCCSFCIEPIPDGCLSYGDRTLWICETCITTAAAAIAQHRASTTETATSLEPT